MFRRIISTINEIKNAKKYASTNGYNFVGFSDSKELIESANKHPDVYDRSYCLIGRQWLFYTDNLFIHILLHFVTGGVTGEWKPGKEKVVIYPVTKHDRLLLMK